ncbi:MAG: Uncharacterized protein G01um101418_835 [Parcubacteria group bacterium Gr01-1014_18]|nr:MAG: Uncharacterized protein Greene041636_785 [Parcubacteria group bacterium Greene0416_36]TSC80032.1 MAG: Uncharacterized protein G01um101418_835 [Parcubacteria group bacterium Gr01-1014_18]TSC98100.1 MAG: Uncharacterized protein Greene101420_871 [Parcubacteria group bacterium Greene1014_20]TSD06616.1 MAG: Uncharacterized protein Greene07142_755 [Parcubacteria group bacterium Greene0714_2]
MKRFTVPQFIDVEDKILGPITTRQFVILLAASLVSFVGYKLFDFTLFLIWVVVWMGGGGIISFAKINGMPFHFFLLNMIQTVRRDPIRVWDKRLSDSQVRAILFTKKDVKPLEIIPEKAPLLTSSLSELSLIADTGGQYEGETVMEGHEVKVGVK